MTMKTLSLSVVGHTNTGKTSLMRTLLRNSDFGEVKNAAATTRHVEEAIINDGAEALVKLYDTPGLEDAGGVLDWLENETSGKQDGIERVTHFLAADVAQTEFAQEAKVLRQLLTSDMALYVIDAREPVLPKYKDELTVLSWCAKPIMPVFNFVKNQDINEWQTMLARRLLHVFASFDTVAFDFEGEIRLWENLATMLPERQVLDQLITMRRQDWQKLDQQAKNHIAHFLINVAAYKQQLDETESFRLPEIQQQMQDKVRQLEKQLQQQLLNLYAFYHNELDADDWALQAFTQDPFDTELLKSYGIRASKGAAAGALIGLGLDALTMGMSLGAATAIGGLLGGIAPNWQVLSDKLSGIQTLYIDNATLTLLAARAMDLLNVLQTRGHAAQDNIRFNSGNTPWSSDKLPNILSKARQNEKWSSLNGFSETEATQNRFQAALNLVSQLSMTH